MPPACALYQTDPRLWLEGFKLWAGRRSYDDEAKAYLARSGHYLDDPPPGAFLAVGLEMLTRGLFGDVPDGRLIGLGVIGRPIARMLPQDGSCGELLRFVIDPGLPRCTASHLLRVAVEAFAAWRSPRGVTPRSLITYHDRSRHSGCIYRKAAFRRDGVSRAGTRRGSWGTRPDRDDAVAAQVTSKRRWRIDLDEVRGAVASRCLVESGPRNPTHEDPPKS